MPIIEPSRFGSQRSPGHGRFRSSHHLRHGPELPLGGHVDLGVIRGTSLTMGGTSLINQPGYEVRSCRSFLLKPGLWIGGYQFDRKPWWTWGIPIDQHLGFSNPWLAYIKEPLIVVYQWMVDFGGELVVNANAVDYHRPNVDGQGFETMGDPHQ